MPIDEPYLNFGAGNPAEGWLNLDASPLFLLPRWMHGCLAAGGIERSKHFGQGAYRHYRHQAGKRLPFNDSSFQAVYCSHVLEHIPADAMDGLLSEFRRVLEPGGILRVVVPDLRTMLTEALGEERPWIPLDEALHVTALTRAPRLVRVLEGWAGFPSMHRVAFLPQCIEEGLGEGWRVRTGLRFLESNIDTTRLRAVEQQRRCENAVIFESATTST